MSAVLLDMAALALGISNLMSQHLKTMASRTGQPKGTMGSRIRQPNNCLVRFHSTRVCKKSERASLMNS